MGEDIDLEKEMRFLVGLTEESAPVKVSAFRDACVRAVKSKSGKDEDKSLDVLARDALAELGLSVRDLTKQQLASVRAACGIYRYVADVLNDKTINLDDLKEAAGGKEDSESESQSESASEESLGDVLVEVSNPRVEVQITATGVMIRPKTEEQRLWLSTVDAKFMASVVNNRAGLVSGPRVPRAIVRRPRWRLR